MRVITWNLGRRRRQANEKAWAYLCNVLHADIALLQEAAAPGDSQIGHLALHLLYRDWGTGVYAKTLALRQVSVPFDPNRLVVCEVSIPAVGPVYLVSLHAPTTKAGKEVDPVKWCNQALDYLDGLVREHPAIVGGDLNASRTAEQWWPGAGNGPLFDRIDAGPLFDCHHKFNCEEEQTYFGSTKVPIQDDHIFVTKPLADLVTKCYAVDNEETRNVSDHIPIVADIAVAAAEIGEGECASGAG